MAFPQAAALGWRAPELEAGVLLLGDDWAEDHHDVELMDVGGETLARARLPEGAAGMARLHAMIGAQLGEDTDAGLRCFVASEEQAGRLCDGGSPICTQRAHHLRTMGTRAYDDLSGLRRMPARGLVVFAPVNTTDSETGTCHA